MKIQEDAGYKVLFSPSTLNHFAGVFRFIPSEEHFQGDLLLVAKNTGLVWVEDKISDVFSNSTE